MRGKLIEMKEKMSKLKKIVERKNRQTESRKKSQEKQKEERKLVLEGFKIRRLKIIKKIGKRALKQKIGAE